MGGKVRTVILWWLKRFGGPLIWNALQDPETREMIVEWINERLPGDIGDGTLIRDLLKFLWENRQEIIEFVLTIIGLFTIDGQLMVKSAGEPDDYPAEALAALETKPFGR